MASIDIHYGVVAKEKEKIPREHTLAQKYLIGLLMWNATDAQKTPQ